MEIPPSALISDYTSIWIDQSFINNMVMQKFNGHENTNGSVYSFDSPMNENRRKKLQRIDLNVMDRLVRTLYENVREKKTNVARNANMGYDKCVIYLDILEIMNFVKKETDGRHELVSLTSAGIKYLERTRNERQVNLQ